jgi:hypothetical protein
MPVAVPGDGASGKPKPKPSTQPRAGSGAGSGAGSAAGWRMGTDFKRWLIAGVIVTLPLMVLQQTAEEWQYPYVMLILLSLMIFYADDIARFVQEVRSI